MKNLNCKLIKCDVTIDPEGKKYPTMHLQYEVETEYEKKLLDIPQAILPLRADHLKVESDMSFFDLCRYRITLDDDRCTLLRAKGELSDEEYGFAEKTIERRAKKMTIEEIEEKLGHKIEIVSDKE